MTATAEPAALRLHLPGLGLDLAALAWGDADLPALIALHGWLDNAASFASIATHLSGARRVIALDLPGHGRSDHLPAAARYDLPLYVQALHAAAAALRLDRFDLLGHSLGGAIASLYAAAFPQRVARLLLIEALGPMADDGGDTLARWRAALAGAGNDRTARVFAGVEDALAARCRSTGQNPAAIRSIVARGVRAHAGGVVWRSDTRLTATTPVRIAEAQVRALLAGIESPVLLLRAEPESPFLPHALLRARAACVPRIDIALLHGGHHLHAEQPEACARLLLRTPGAASAA